MTLIGAINGFNTTFGTTTDYKPGSVLVYLNGQLKEAVRDDGWVELGLQQVKLKEAPRAGDVVQAYLIPLT